ncbi:uncharacterized protein PV09_00356 [Verruconis gallopava]|uniref:Thioesterase domain-containing protein n=1 Tax=Verruconis gallopava TaxID=253628 RepID=A0A0D1Z928_9PEZI|nr:uncharacterized protein PV09_00356 [Verruconis gallopava]KIW09477.1 hypothetical protein PV09_00356 [Verruconis gallopava]
MNFIRPSKQLLRGQSPFRVTNRCQIRQWHPRSTQRRFASSEPLTYRPRSKIRPFMWALVFGCTGFLVGKSMALAVKLFDSIERDSEEDILLLKAIVLAADGIPFVQEMLKHEGDVEWDWNEISLYPQEGDTVINQTLRGSMGLVTPRAFWNEKEKELVMAVYYGGALCGWPGIAHGGCTATVLLEGMGRALNCLTGGRQSIRPPEPSELSLTYLKPVHAQNYYLLKAKLKAPEESIEPQTNISADKDLTKKLHHERSGIISQLNIKYNVECVLEDLKGHQCMKAKGVWNVL